MPNERGLGSSDIICGVIAATNLLGKVLKKEDMLQIATYIRGFTDKVTPALYGGLR